MIISLSLEYQSRFMAAAQRPGARLRSARSAFSQQRSFLASGTGCKVALEGKEVKGKKKKRRVGFLL